MDAFVRTLLVQPVVRVKDVEQHLDISYTKANQMIAQAQALNMIEQISEGRRNRKYAYREYIAILSEGTELSNITP